MDQAGREGSRWGRLHGAEGASGRFWGCMGLLNAREHRAEQPRTCSGRQTPKRIQGPARDRVTSDER